MNIDHLFSSPFSEGPHLQAALFCERIDIRDGSVSLHNIVDNLIVKPHGQYPPERLPPVKLDLHLYLRWKSGRARGAYQVAVEIVNPNGDAVDPLTLEVSFLDNDCAVAHQPVHLQINTRIEGTYWCNVYLDRIPVTKIPVTVQYVPEQTRRSEEARMGKPYYTDLALLREAILTPSGSEAINGLASFICSISERPDWTHEDALSLNPLIQADSIIALSAVWGAPALADFESRCAESGIATVMTTDFRNFAHGRHQWLVERSDSTAILSLEYPGVGEDAASLISLMPTHIPVIRVRSSRAAGPAASLDLVVSLMYVVGEIASARGLDPGDPVVSDFGRRMYHMDSLRWSADR